MDQSLDKKSKNLHNSYNGGVYSQHSVNTSGLDHFENEMNEKVRLDNEIKKLVS